MYRLSGKDYGVVTLSKSFLKTAGITMQGLACLK